MSVPPQPAEGSDETYASPDSKSNEPQTSLISSVTHFPSDRKPLQRMPTGDVGGQSLWGPSWAPLIWTIQGLEYLAPKEAVVDSLSSLLYPNNSFCLFIYPSKTSFRAL